MRVSASPDGDFAQDIAAGSYLMRADEPASVPGDLVSGPPPYDFLLAGPGACTPMTLHLYARQKGWPLDAEMRTRLLQIADKCPVHKSLEASTKISTSLS